VDEAERIHHVGCACSTLRKFDYLVKAIIPGFFFYDVSDIE